MRWNEILGPSRRGTDNPRSRRVRAAIGPHVDAIPRSFTRPIARIIIYWFQLSSVFVFVLDLIWSAINWGLGWGWGLAKSLFKRAINWEIKSVLNRVPSGSFAFVNSVKTPQKRNLVRMYQRQVSFDKVCVGSAVVLAVNCKIAIKLITITHLFICALNLNFC